MPGAMKSTGDTPVIPARPEDVNEVRNEENKSVSPQSRSRRTAADGDIDATSLAAKLLVGGVFRFAPGGSLRSGAAASCCEMIVVTEDPPSDDSGRFVKS